jgi:hypothetical protein
MPPVNTVHKLKVNCNRQSFTDAWMEIFSAWRMQTSNLAKAMVLTPMGCFTASEQLNKLRIYLKFT